MTCHDIGRHLHCYGVETVRSPHLDTLAASGVLFTRAFCTAPQCSPSRASIATGLYPHNNGVLGLAHDGFDWEISPGVPHAAGIFHNLGFESHLFGNQHVSLHPERLGFDGLHSPGLEHGNATGLTVASQVEDFLIAHGPDGRLYLEINFDDTHRPYPELPVADDWPVIPPYLPPGPEAAQEMRGAELAIEEMDAAVGRVLVALERAGRAEGALVIFTTDHGLAMPRAKCTLYDPGIEVALMVRLPGAPAPSTSAELISNIDILPTMVEAAGAPVPAHVQGRSFLSLLSGGTYEPTSAVFAEKTFHSYYDPMRCVRTTTHKLIRNFETAFAVEVPGDIQQGAVFRADPGRYSTDRRAITELYDLTADPGEEHNLSGTMEVRDLERRLNEELWDWMAKTDDPLLRGPVSSPRYRAAMQR